MRGERIRRSEDPRNTALSILFDIFEKGKHSHIALREELSKHKAMPERDRAFLTRLVNGTVERSVTLDYFLDRCSRCKVKKMRPLLRTLLRMGSFQILFSDRVPDSAAVNESVKLSHRRGLSGLSSFVNAVLRRISGEKESILRLLREEGEIPEYVRFSLPEWLYHFLLSEYGREETERMAAYFLSEEHGNYVRFRDGRCVKRSGNLSEEEAFRCGEMTIQDYSSQQVGLLASPSGGEFVVDVCASPGGKCCHVAELLGGSGRVDARDITEEKIRLIEENIERLHLKNIKAKLWDARKSDPSLTDSSGRGRADLLLCDLPCSGLGVLHKKPDIRFSAGPERILELQRLQREILDCSQSYVKPGGRLIYSTCTLSRAENEENRDYILEHFAFTLLSERKFLPGQPSDGFYIAEFRRREEKEV